MSWLDPLLVSGAESKKAQLGGIRRILFTFSIQNLTKEKRTLIG